MTLSIVVIIFVLGVAFFHYIQGFFSATLSAILAIVSAALALSLQEVLTEGPLAGTAPEWMPSITLMLLFAVIYVILRTIFDKLIPGNVRMPPLLEKLGGGAMGVVAGVFAVGICVIALQQMPLGASLAGYTRYATDGTRNVAVLVQTGTGFGQNRAKDAATFDEMTADHFDREKASRLLFPVDDMVVNAVAHLSDNGSLQAGKPLKSVHPSLLDELFGQRLGYQFGVNRTALNAASKNKSEVTVEGVYRLPDKPEPGTYFSSATDAEFKKLRTTPIVLKPISPDEIRVAVRVRLADTMADKDRLIRLTPGAVRLVALAADELVDPSGEPQPHDYYPIGTLESNGVLYLNKIDDPLFIDAKGKKAAGGGEGPAEIDFVFEVKAATFAEQGADKTTSKVTPDSGTFIEVKKFARVDLDGKDIKPLKSNVSVIALKRKHLEWEGQTSPAPPVPGKAAPAAPAPDPAAAAAAPAAPAPAAPAPTPGAPAPAPAPDANMSKLVGTWENDTGLSYTFRLDGTYSGTQAASGATPAKSGGGTWKVTTADGDKIKIELLNKSGKASPQEWDASQSADGQIQRIVEGNPPITFKRKG